MEVRNLIIITNSKTKGVIMEKWKKQHDFITVADIVQHNTGLTKDDLLDVSKDYMIYGVDEVRKILYHAMSLNQTVYIICDYDADGIGAGAILVLLCRLLGIKYKVIVPRRFSQGYGLSDKIIEEIPNGSLIITVDNGITSLSAVKKAKERDMTVIITDHHLPLPSGELPFADVIIDPNAIADSADFNDYCGAGIALKIAECVIGKYHPLIKKMTSIATISTIADVVPLVKGNRNIVIQGLSNLTTQDGRTTGLYALLKLTELDSHITETDIGFTIAPCINAAGRMFDNGGEIALSLLTFEGDLNEAFSMARELICINESRKLSVQNGINTIDDNIMLNGTENDRPLCIYEPTISEGIVGILAGRYAESHKVPCFVFTDAHGDSSMIKGSARTFGDVNLKALLDECAKHMNLVKYGGHRAAAGLSILRNDFDTFVNILSRVCSELYPITNNIDDTRYYDLEIDEHEISYYIDKLKEFAPYGEGNPRIKFLIKDYMLMPRLKGFANSMGKDEQHLKLYGANSSALGFGMNELYKSLNSPKRVDLIGCLSENWYRDNVEAQVEISNLKASHVKPQSTNLSALLVQKSKERRVVTI